MQSFGKNREEEKTSLATLMPGANCDHHHKSSSIQFSLEEAAQERVGRCCLPLLTAYDNPACLEISQCKCTAWNLVKIPFLKRHGEFTRSCLAYNEGFPGGSAHLRRGGSLISAKPATLSFLQFYGWTQKVCSLDGSKVYKGGPLSSSIMCVKR